VAKESLSDTPMPLGDHLEELRRRCFWVIGVAGLSLIVAFFFQADLKLLMVQPLARAIELIDPDDAKALDLPTDTSKILRTRALAESAINSVLVSLYAAIAITFPFIVYQVWGFIRPALHAKEVRAAFFFFPAAVVFFYAGVVFGYFVGLPQFFTWLMDWTARDPTASFLLTQREYLGFFFMMTIAFGIILDIPWFVMVLTRVGLVSPDTLAKNRKIVIMVCVVLAAMLTPPDPMSQIAFFIPMVLLFELGLLGSRIMHRRRLEGREEEEEEA